MKSPDSHSAGDPPTPPSSGDEAGHDRPLWLRYDEPVDTSRHVRDDEPVPLVRGIAGTMLPDLGRIPQRRWREALIPLDAAQRDAAARETDLPLGLRIAATELAWTLPPPPSDSARAAVRRGASVAVPVSPAAPRRRNVRQVGFRLDDEAYEDLLTACRILRVKPAALARALTCAGVARTLAEYDVALDEARHGRSRAGTLDP